MSKIRLEREGSKYIALRGWIGPQTPGLCKSVPGARFKPEPANDKRWLYPLDYGVCLALREAFGQQLDIGPELASWARAARDEAARLREIAGASSATLVNVPRYAPKIAQAMANRTYQQVAAAFGARAGSFLLTDQPGLGKTIETLAALIEANGERRGLYLIFCPKVAVESVWAAEVAQWIGDRADAFALTGTRQQREDTLTAALVKASWRKRDVFVIANIEMARIKPETVYAADGSKKVVHKVENAEYPALLTAEWDAIIVDESHRALIRTSGKPTQTLAGMRALKAPRRIALSGTPMRGKPEQLWGTLNWLRPDLYGGYWKWVERYFNLKSNGFSNYVLDGMRTGAQDRMAEDLRTISLRRTKAEVLSELPPKQYAGSHLIADDPNSPLAVWLTLDGKQAKQYREFERDAAIETDSGELSANGILAENTRKKQLAGAALDVTADGKVRPILPSVKFDWLVEKLTELGIVEGEGDSKIVVASQFTSLLNLFTRELRAMGIAVHLLTGETPDKARHAMIEDFQTTDEVRVFLLNTKAGGVAVTLDRADDLVLLDETYVPDDQEQVEDRIHRTSRIHNVTIYNLRVLDTIEEEIAWITAAREDVQKYLLDGARGVEQARKIYQAKMAS